MANSNFVVKNGLTVGNVVVDAGTGNITGVNSLSFASGTNGILAAGNSNVLVVANGNVAVSSAGNANIVVVTSTGANVAGYANIALGTITAAQTIISKSVTWNNASVTFTALSTSITDTASAAGSNIADWKVGGVSQFSVNKAGNTSIAGTLNVTGNANTGNLGTGTIIATTANLTTINSGLLQNGTSNLSIVNNGNIAVSVGGTTNVVVWTTTGLVAANANVSGYANIVGNANAGNIGTGGILSVTGNANTGNLGTATIVATTANLTTINSGLLQNGTSNVTVTSSGNITLNITSANNYQFSTGSILPNANGTQNLGGATNYFSTLYGKATTAQYADVAELYESDEPYSPGTVLDFGGTHEVTICGEAMSTRVAGVVSTNPALRMNSTLAADNKVELALLGRVPTRVVGPVSKGDMMVSAGNGYAMACSSPAIGSVIGKALEDFSAEKGIIEVVVGRL